MNCKQCGGPVAHGNRTATCIGCWSARNVDRDALIAIMWRDELTTGQIAQRMRLTLGTVKGVVAKLQGKAKVSLKRPRAKASPKPPVARKHTRCPLPGFMTRNPSGSECFRVAESVMLRQMREAGL